MTEKITSRQNLQAQKLVGDALTSLNPSKDGMQRVLGSKEFMIRFKQLVMELATDNFYVLLSDDQAIAWIVKYANTSEDEACQIVYGFRQQARACGITDAVKIHVEVRPGCLFKRDISNMGPTWESFKYLQYWNFPDPSTEHALVSWVPTPLVSSTNKNVAEQTEAIAAFKMQAELPAWYKVSFGSINHVSGLSLVHFSATGKDPFTELWVRTDSFPSDIRRLELRWKEGKLCCTYQYWAENDRNFDLGVFPVGAIKAFVR